LETTLDWPELLAAPGPRDHMVELYKDRDFLVDSVARFIGAGLRGGEAGLVIARASHRTLFEQALAREGLFPHPALVMVDADETLARFMVDGMPQWTAFHQACGGAIAELKLQHATVRAYGEMVDILWQRNERNAAVRLEEFWNELALLQTFSLLCAYGIDPLADGPYDLGLDGVCRTHTHVIPARSFKRFNQAVSEALGSTLDQPLAQMALRLAANQRPQADMPLGQATLFWLRQNMPRTAERVLEHVRANLQN
jgi:hypothetical protein